MRTFLAIGAVTAVAAGALTAAVSSQAATPGVDLGITGSVVTGVTHVDIGQEVPFTFTMKNHSSTRTANVAFAFTNTATAGGDDYLCATTTHSTVSPDTPDCEPGDLLAGQSVNAAIMLHATRSGTLTVTACALNLNGTPDPVSSNNCKTLNVTVY
jgi:Domain of unknown function DUF11